jgi:two-component system, OmpR family, sensor kinase
MGRLFWKLFLVIWLAMSGMLIVGYVLYSLGLETVPRFEVMRNEAQFAANSAKRLVELGGPEAIRPLQDLWSVPPFDLMISARLLPPGEAPPSETGYTSVAHASHNGSNYIVSATPDGAKFRWQPFTKPHVTAAVISLIAAWLLARYLYRPIRLLRLALHAVAEGRFETRVSLFLGKRRDELADLSRDADRMAAQLQQLSDQQKRLLHDVSHELRSPLARMKAAAGLARQNQARSSDMMNRIDREVERLDALVEEILTLARLESAKDADVTLECARVDLVDILTAIVEDATFEGQARGVSIVFDAAQLHGGFVCEVNGELIYRGLENVIRNAVKFTADGTTVRVEARRKEADGTLCIRVTDQGLGIAPDEADLIFEPFWRGMESRHALRGHGLGLAIAKRAFAYHGGSIRATPAASGCGLTIEIALPLSREKQQPA